MKAINFFYLMILTCSTILSSCNEAEDPINQDDNDIKVTTTQILSDANQKFGFNLLKEEINQNKDKNVIISPLSVQLAILMAIN